ncbi:MAG: hypothetical protein V3W20_14280, partial [Candidatus Neomarinimicrobiota bacterium]
VSVDLYKNGAVVEGAGLTRFMSVGQDISTVTAVGVVQLSHLDYIEVYVTLTAAGTVTFSRLAITINEMVGAI